MFAIKFQWKNEYIKNFWVPGILPAINATVSCCLYHTFDTVHRYQSSLCCFKIQHLITGYKQMLRGSLGYVYLGTLGTTTYDTPSPKKLKPALP